MKIIFLDVDGVLNNFTILQEGITELSEESILLLKKIIEETKSEVVISSSWRLWPETLKELHDKLLEFGIKPIDKTKELSPVKFSQSVERRKEIQEWLSRNKVENFAILDDDEDASIEGHFFQTDFNIGLTNEIAEEVIKFLNE